MPNIHCFYHSADLDGHCSGAIVKYRFPEAIMHPINYGDEFPLSEIGLDDEVFILDFSLQPFQLMENLYSVRKITWIDHHSSSIKEWQIACERDESLQELLGRRDTSKAACELTWEYLFPDKPVPLAVKLLSLYDSWTYQGHELEEMVLPFQMRMRMEELNPRDWEVHKQDWYNLFVAGFSEILSALEQGRLLLRYDEEQKRKYVGTYGFETVLHEITPAIDLVWKAIAVNLGHTNSKVFDSVYDPDKHDLMITFCRRSDRKWNVSLYSTKPEVDCGAIAKSFGGGGHAGAAGFQCNELPFDY